MKYLVTGASGFLGSNLCEALLAKGHTVIGVDSNLIGRVDNIKFLLNSPRFTFIEKDVLEYHDTPAVDGIFHLASPTAPAETYKHPQITLQVNTDGTSSLLETAEFLRIPLLYASSVKVSDEMTFSSAYIAGKREGERICEGYSLAKVCRMGNIYGPRMAPDDSRVIPTYCRNLRDGKPLSVWGDGQQVDSFCYVSDLIIGMIEFMRSPATGVMEFGDPHGITIENLAQTFIGVVGRGKDTVICYEQPGGAVCMVPVDGTMSSNRTVSALHGKARKVPDIARAASELNWLPRVPLEVGLRKTFEYYQHL